VRPWTSALVGAMLVTSLVVAMPQASAAAAAKPKDPQKVTSVPGGVVPVKPLVASTAPELTGTAEVRWPSAAKARVTPGADAVRAGAAPVWVSATGSAPAPGAVTVETLGQDASAKAGVAGVLVKVGRADGVKTAGPVTVTVDYSGYRDAYGADWGSRLRLVPLSGDVATGPQHNDVKAGWLSAQVPAGPEATTFAVAAAPEGATGDFKATSLSPATNWQVSTQTGAFTWSYPFRTPSVPGGLAPTLNATYNSGSVDGRVPTANNQTSWLGEGWQLTAGYIERRYRGCGDDLGGNQNQTKTGDLCWKLDNAMVSFGEHSGELVRNGETDVWRFKDDDGTRVDHLYGTGNGDDNGEHWRLTTTDGTQYYFGKNKMPDGRADTQSAWTVPVAGNNAGEPCNQTTFADSFCTQAYRWNLDYVVDVHGNAMIYTYAPENNKYGQNLSKATATYTRGGVLRQIEYGIRTGSTDKPAARVVFGALDRCVEGQVCASHTKTSWPDVPWDRDCTGATCPDKWAPTFWSTKRLATVTTQILGTSPSCTTAVDGYCSVDQWTTTHKWPVTGDGTDPALWLDGISHVGLAGGTSAAQSTGFVLDPINKANRINTQPDGLPSGNKHRLKTINLESGGQIDIVYKGQDCRPGMTMPSPDVNGLRCFPVRWSPDKAEPIDDWFYKYVVDAVTQIDRVGGAPSQTTSYDYEDTPAWAYVDDQLVDEKYRSWTDFRGYGSVRVRKGDPTNTGDQIQSATRYRYFRGMFGDKKKPDGTKSPQVDGINDLPQYAGFLREEITLDGVSTKELSATVNDPWYRETAARGTTKANMVDIQATYTRTAVTGGVRRTESHTSFGDGTKPGDVGLPIQVDDRGDVADPGDDRCTTTAYAVNTDTWLVSLPKTEKTVGVKCGATATLPRDAVSDKRHFYDGHDLDAPPTEGNTTKTEELSSVTGKTEYVTESRAEYDGYGRVKKSFDANGYPTTTSYTDTFGLQTAAKEINPLGYVTTTTYEPAWQAVLSVKDANNAMTDAEYDSLGRITKVWRPGRSKANGDGPTVRYGYGVRTDGASWVSTDTLKPNKNYVTTLQLFDGFLRPRQTQAPSPVGGRVVTDTLYDTRGLVRTTNAPYYNDQSGPAKNLFAPNDAQIPNQTVTVYEGAERKSKETYEKLNEPQWATTYEYTGDSVAVTPPSGGTPTRTFTNARGQETELREYTDGTTNGSFVATKKSYTKAGVLATITDAANNVWTDGYDVAGNKVSYTDPDHGSGTYTYDAAGRLVSGKDARDQVVVRVYDKLNRLTETHEDSPTGPLLAKWTYDTVKLGQLSSTTRYVDGKEYTEQTTAFDVANRPTDADIVIPASEGGLKGTYHTHTEYAADGSVSSVTLPQLGPDKTLKPETLTYTYDTLGMLKTAKGTDAYVTDAAYTALGELSQLQLGVDGQRVWRTTYREDGTRRLASTTIDRETEKSARVDDTFYSYDKIGNVTKIEDQLAGVAVDRQCMSYDGLRRMTEAWTSTQDCAAPGAALGGPAQYWNSYRTDGIGRRLSQTQRGGGGAPETTTTMTYPGAGQPQPHAPATVSVAGQARGAGAMATGTGSYSYDRTGNTETRPTGAGDQTYEWDAEGQLTEVRTAGRTTTYVNAPNNSRLLAKQDTGAATLYLPSGELAVSQSGGVTGTRSYQFGGEVVATRTAQGVSYLVGDHQGTSTLAIDAKSLEPVKRRFDPFGVARGTAPAQWPGDYGFVGGAADQVTGLTRLGLRDYDANTGKFLSVDPVRGEDNPQQLNAYAYSVNNPATFSDPSGAAPICNKFGDCIQGHDTGASNPEIRQQERAAREQNARNWARDHDEWTKPRPKEEGGNLRVGKRGPSWADADRAFWNNLAEVEKYNHDHRWPWADYLDKVRDTWGNGVNVSLCEEFGANPSVNVSACLGADSVGLFVSADLKVRAAPGTGNQSRAQTQLKIGGGNFTPGGSSSTSITTPVNVRGFGLKVGINNKNGVPSSVTITYPANSKSVSVSIGGGAYLMRWDEMPKSRFQPGEDLEKYCHPTLC
jgi:RHS repeat-associated protein